MLGSVKSSSSNCLRAKSQLSLPAVVVLSYFTASEKENLRTERKQNQEMKNEKREKISDSYYLSNRKVSKVVCSSRISLLAFYSSEEVGSVSITVLWQKAKDKAGSVSIIKFVHLFLLLYFVVLFIPSIHALSSYFTFHLVLWQFPFDILLNFMTQLL